MSSRTADDNAISLTPAFAAATNDYSSLVASGIDEITVTPTLNESNSTVEYLDADDTAIDDADMAEGGQQVSLAVGENTIKVKVTAEDDATTETYTVVVSNIVEVSVEAGASPVTEGADATFTLKRDGPTTVELTVDVTVEETGSMLSSGPPTSATFAAGASTTTLTVETEDDAPVEDPSTVTVTIEAGAGYQATAGTATAEVVVLDDLPSFVLSVRPEEVTEGGGGAVTVEITNGVSFTTAQTISLALGGTATADDFTLLNTSGWTLSAPYTLTIPAGEGVAAVYITIVNDAMAEPEETLTVTASHDGTEIATGAMTLRASPLRLELSSLAASGGGGRAMYPAFDPGTLHYAVGCDPSRTLTLRLSTSDATTRLAVNWTQQVNQNAVVELDQLDGDDDILITLSNAAGASTTYVVHCMHSDDPFIRVVKRPGSSTELIGGSLNPGA